jgi:hypothetical protein
VAAFLRLAHLEERFYEARAVAVWEEVVLGHLGPTVAGQTKAEGVLAGELRVRVVGDALRHRLSFERSTLLGKVHTAVGSRVLRSIRLV